MGHRVDNRAWYSYQGAVTAPQSWVECNVQKMTLADNLREVSAVQASVEGPSKVGRVPQPQSVQTGVSQPVGDGQEG